MVTPVFEPGDTVGGTCWCFAKPFTLLGSANWVAGEARAMAQPQIALRICSLGADRGGILPPKIARGKMVLVHKL